MINFEARRRKRVGLHAEEETTKKLTIFALPCGRTNLNQYSVLFVARVHKVRVVPHALNLGLNSSAQLILFESCTPKYAQGTEKICLSEKRPRRRP